MIHKYISILSLLLTTFTFAQNKDEFLYGPSLGYQNQSGNFGKLGLFYSFGFSDNFLITKIDANVNMTYMRDQFRVIPEIGITEYFPLNNSSFIYPFVKSEFTPYTITPKIGFTFLTLIDYGIGYGFKINEKDNFKPIKGFQFSVSLNLPLNFNIY